MFYFSNLNFQINVVLAQNDQTGYQVDLRKVRHVK